jgi:tetratricopeptide (TPR) repeat protein
VFKAEQAWKLKNGETLEEAEKAYKELCDLERGEMSEELKRDSEAGKSEMRYLTCRYELVEILRRLGKNEEALHIAKETWRRREKRDRSRSGTEQLRCETKESHQQYCSLLRALGKSKDAKDEYRKVYPSAIDLDPEWAIVNGYQLGMVFLQEHQDRPVEDRYEQAGFKHWEIYEKGKQKLNLASGIMIDIAE